MVKSRTLLITIMIVITILTGTLFGLITMLKFKNRKNILMTQQTMQPTLQQPTLQQPISQSPLTLQQPQPQQQQQVTSQPTLQSQNLQSYQKIEEEEMFLNQQSDKEKKSQSKKSEEKEKKEKEKKKTARDIFEEYYLMHGGKKTAKGSTQQLQTPLGSLPDLSSVVSPLPTSPTSTITPPAPSTGGGSDIVVYGFYEKGDKIFVVTNIGILTENSKISDTETVKKVDRHKIITNKREIRY